MADAETSRFKKGQISHVVINLHGFLSFIKTPLRGPF